MKFASLVIASVLTLASTAYSQEINLVCLTGHAADMDLKIESFQNGKEKLSVTLTAMDGETIRTFVNSNFENLALTKSLSEARPVRVIVSKSDLAKKLDGGYADAGMVEISFNKFTDKYDVLFAAEGNVYMGTCQEQAK